MFKFAEDELALLAITGSADPGTGLPLTDNQLKKTKQIKETETKRAAAAHDKMISALAPMAAAAVADPKKTPGKPGMSHTINGWAQGCNDWKKQGFCNRGCNCHYKHPGFLRDGTRCVFIAVPLIMRTRTAQHQEGQRILTKMRIGQHTTKEGRQPKRKVVERMARRERKEKGKERMTKEKERMIKEQENMEKARQ